MNKIIYILSLLLLPFLSFAQVQSNNFVTKDSSFVAFGSEVWTYRIQYPADYFTPNHPDTASRPAIIFMPGQGEVGNGLNTPSLFTSFGPFYWKNNGWDGGVQCGNGRHYPILITILISYANPRGPQIVPFIQHLQSKYKIKPENTHWIGFSMGGFTAGKLIAYQASAGAETGMKLIRSFVALQGAGYETFSPYNAWSLGNASYGRWAKQYDGRFFGVEGTTDTRNLWQHRNSMDDSLPGNAYFTYENIGGGAHCCYNEMMNPSRTNWNSVTPPALGSNIATNGTTGRHNSMGTYQIGDNIFTWAFKQGDTTMVGEVDGGFPPVANAGSNQEITLPNNSVDLSGSGSTGVIDTYLWKQVSGPAESSILTPNSVNTVVEDLVQGTYLFRLIVENSDGEDSSDVTVVVNPYAPPVANAGSNQSINLPTSSTTLDGSGSIGVIESYLWEQVSGPTTAVISSTNQESTLVSDLEEGTYVFKLTVTNTQGSSSSEVTVTVNLISPIPSADVTQRIGTGEYQVGFIDNNKRLWAVGNLTNIGTNNTGTFGIPQYVQVSPSDLKFKYVSGGLHHLVAIDTAGYVWTMGDNYQGTLGKGDTEDPYYAPYRITTDSSGNPFVGIKEAKFSFFPATLASAVFAIKDDGSLWAWGRLDRGFRGNGVDDGDMITTRPVQIIIPGDREVKEITVGNTVVALCTDGTVWTWGGMSYNNLGRPNTGTYHTPTQLTSLVDIVHVAGGYQFCYALKDDGTLYGWGAWGNFLGDPTHPTGGGSPYPSPTVLTHITNSLPYPIRKLVTTYATTHAILTDGSLWGWGDNAQGGVGNGESIDWPNYSTPYAWNGVVGQLWVKTPVNIAPTVKFKDVFGGGTYNYYSYAIDSSDNMYSWGRDKGAVLSTGIVSPNSTFTAQRQNSWDRNWPTPVNPFTLTQVYISTTPTCIGSPSSGICSTYAIPSNVPPVANAGQDREIVDTFVTLNALGSTDNVFISYYLWEQIDGPSQSIIDLPASPTPKVSGLEEGTYTFRLTVTDNGWLTSQDTITVYVGESPTKEKRYYFIIPKRGKLISN